MTGIHFPKAKPGMTLMETVIAIAIVAVAIPLIFGVMGAASGSRRQAGDETKAPFIARSLMDDIQRGWRGQGYFFEEDLAFPEFGGSGQEMVFGFDLDGEFVSKITGGENASGVKNPEISYVAEITGETPKIGTFLAGETDPSKASLIVVMVQTPAAAKPADRKTMIFQTLKVPSND